MKKLSIFLFLMMQSVSALLAHPLDVSNTTMSLYDDYVMGVTYVHPVELDRILVSRAGISPASIGVDSYYSLTGILVSYLAETIEFQNQGKNCTIWEYSFQEELMVDEIYSWGFPISYIFRCDAKIYNPIITINFLVDVPLQTNKLSLYRTIDGEMKRSDYRVLNARKNNHSVSFSLKSEKLADTDMDGITDEDEYIYRTNPHKSDSDDDGYNDALEIEKSWDPISSRLSPWQKAYDGVQNSSTGMTIVHTLTEDSSVWWSVYFSKILSDIRKFADADMDKKNIFILLSLIASLWFLHAMGPWHSKGILISQILDENMSYGKSVLYCLFFTVFHLLDVIIVVILSKLLFAYLDSSIYISFISKMSAILIICMSIYLLISSIRKYISRNTSFQSMKKASNKQFIWLAIMTGLAPCAFGWTIFLMLIAIGKTYLAIPFLLALGIWIFLCLFSIATLTWYMKYRVYHISPAISRFSPVLSSFFLLIIGCGLVLQNF